MNHSWIAYKNALRELPNYISPQDEVYDRIEHLQSMLMHSIPDTHQNDTPALQAKRKHLVIELENLMKLDSRGSFIELCLLTTPVFNYLTRIYQAVLYACEVFGTGRVWPAQCRGVTERFSKQLQLDDTLTRSVLAITQSSLSYISNRFSELAREIEDFARRCSQTPDRLPESLQNEQGKIWRQLDFFATEVRTVDQSSFEEFLCIWQEVIGRLEAKRLPMASSVSLLYRPASDIIAYHATPAPNALLVTNHKYAHENHNKNIDHSISNKLVDLVLKIPDIDQFETRTALLTNIPNSQSLPRNQANPRTDITRLIGSLAGRDLPNRPLTLCIFIENAIAYLDGSQHGEELKTLCDQLKAFH